MFSTGTEYTKTVDADVSFLPDAVLQKLGDLIKHYSLKTRQEELKMIEAFAAKSKESDGHSDADKVAVIS